MDVMKMLGLDPVEYGGSTGRERIQRSDVGTIEVVSPVDGRALASVHGITEEDYDRILDRAVEAFSFWRRVPAPRRGDIVRHFGRKFREAKDALGRLVSLEMGKPLQEGWGEVQEMIDICDFAVGQSRQLYGFTMASERPNHRLYDQYHPLGVVGIVTAFNFPVAVWAWNAMLAAVCGNVMVWKPSSKTPLTALAVQRLAAEVLEAHDLPEGIFNLVIGPGKTVGERMLNDRRVPLISLTGSTEVGRHANAVVASRFGRMICELGGNNAVIVTPEADLKLALPAIVFGAVGTAGQRCTTTRRLIVHAEIYEQVKQALIKAYASLKIGSPLDPAHHLGPLVDRPAVRVFTEALDRAREQGARRLHGGEVLAGPGFESGCYVVPALVEAENRMPVVQQETFAPILYLLRYEGDIQTAIAIQNDVPQGHSSALFTRNLQEAETFLSAWGSDCGIANVNVGTSGAEIGGAFGGEKETGGGRESGSDAWKGYMRRQTNTINFGHDLPLAQGVVFELAPENQAKHPSS